MQDGPRPVRRHRLLPLCAGAVAIVAICPLAHADEPPPPPPAFTGDPINITLSPMQTQQGQAGPGGVPDIVGPPTIRPTLTGMGLPNLTAPIVHSGQSYTIPNLPGTYTAKVEFPYSAGTSSVKEQRVLAADTAGKAMTPNLVRIAYLTQDNNFWVFFPGTGRLEKVSGWPAVYPGIAPPGRQLNYLSDLFAGPGGPAWLQQARGIAVGIAALVITGGAVQAFGIAPALQTMAAAVPLAW